ncbi:MAG: hypothetical protein WCV91_04985 [Candidatus Margulisiibacteriota bacterium]
MKKLLILAVVALLGLGSVSFAAVKNCCAKNAKCCAKTSDCCK